MRPTSIFFPLTYAATPRWLGRAGTLMADAGVWAAALVGATWLRYEFDLGHVDPNGLARITAAAVALVWLAGVLSHLYLGRYPAGSLDEALNLAVVTGVVCLAVLGMDLVRGEPAVPLSVPVIAAFLALPASLGLRLVVRGHRARKARPDRRSARRVIVYGAGTRGRELVRAMLSGAAGDTLPVALLDDDPALRHSRISGVPVRGTWRELVTVARQTRAQQLIVAFADPAPAKIRAVKALARTARLAVHTVAPLSEQLRPWNRLPELWDLDVAELLCRQRIEVNLIRLSGCLRGKRVLVTGAGGTVGGELCRWIHRLGPAELLMLDRDPSALHEVRLSMLAEPRLDSPAVLLADITGGGRLRELFTELRPDLVFHAAGLTQPALLERHPEQAWQTNVVGALAVLEAARQAGVRRLINISSAAAAHPVTVLGRSNRIAERLVADAAGRTGGAFVSVRLGEVLDGRASVLTTFAEQLAAGRALTVPHPDATRPMMTAAEAVRLAIQAAATGSPGEVLVPDLGSPVRLAELAELLMAMSGCESRIVYTGLGRGEELDEPMLGPGECDLRPIHPAITHVPVPRLAANTVLATCARLGCAAAMAELVESPRIVAPRRGGSISSVGIVAAGRPGREAEAR